MTLEDRAAALSQAEIVTLLRQNEALAHQAAELQRQVEWFKRQLFGQKSERRLRAPDAQQLPLVGLRPVPSAPADAPPPPTETVKAYKRRTRFAALEDAPDESGLRFDPSVPVEVIRVPHPDLVGLTEADYEVIGGEGDLPPRPTARRLCPAQVCADGHQAQGDRGALLSPRPAGRLGEEPGGCEFAGRAAAR